MRPTCSWSGRGVEPAGRASCWGRWACAASPTPRAPWRWSARPGDGSPGEVAPAQPGSLTIALLVALAIGMEKWRLLGQQAGWVSCAGVLMLTVGASDPGAYVLRHAGLTLIGA